MVVKDCMGNLITKGCTVVYPVRRGSMMWLKRITVEEIRGTGDSPTVAGYNDTGRRINLMKPSRSVVVPVACAHCGQNPFEAE